MTTTSDTIPTGTHFIDSVGVESYLTLGCDGKLLIAAMDRVATKYGSGRIVAKLYVRTLARLMQNDCDDVRAAVDALVAAGVIRLLHHSGRFHDREWFTCEPASMPPMQLSDSPMGPLPTRLSGPKPQAPSRKPRTREVRA